MESFGVEDSSHTTMTADQHNGNVSGLSHSDIAIYQVTRNSLNVITDIKYEDKDGTAETITLSSGTSNVTADSDIEHYIISNNYTGTLTLSSASHTVTGSDNANRVIGMGGNDSIVGGKGQDSLEGGQGTIIFILKLMMPMPTVVAEQTPSISANLAKIFLAKP